MTNLYDYLIWRGDLSFAQVPMNEVDALILAWLSYTEWAAAVPAPGKGEPVPLRDAAEAFLAATPRKLDDSSAYSINAAVTGAVVAREAAKTRRFGELRVCGFLNEIVPEEKKQFSAVTLLGPGWAYISYRGTDSTLVGWRENCDLSLSEAVPAQRRAVEYLSEVPELRGRTLHLGGHSKGGNLAVYAGALSREPLRSRIEAVWDFDGPGFVRSFTAREDFRAMRPRIRKYVPRDSVVGMLLESSANPIVVPSAQMGLFQHNGVLWEVLGDHLVRHEGLSAPIRVFDQGLEEWLNGLDEQGRGEFIDALFRVLDATGAERIEDFSAEGLGGMLRAFRALTGMEEEKRRMLQHALIGLIRTGNAALFTAISSPPRGLLDKGQKALRDFLTDVTRALTAGKANEENTFPGSDQ